MKPKTPTKETAHRLAAALSLGLAFAAGGAWANSNWKGTTDNDFGTDSNWSNHVPLNDVMVVDSGNFTSRFANQDNQEIVFADYYENTSRAVIRKVGTADNPLVFRATTAEYGLQFGSSGDAPLNVANANGDAYVRFENGKWSTGAKNMLVGSSSYAGYLTLKDINSFTVGTYLNLANGSLALDGGTFSIGAGEYSRIGSAGTTAAFTIERGSVTQGNHYLGIGEGAESTATMTVKSGGSFTNTQNANGIIVGTDSPGTLNIQGGTVTLKQLTFYRSTSTDAAGGSVVNITEGGVLETRYVVLNKNYSAMLNLDGGTLKVPNDFNGGVVNSYSTFDFTVGSNGGTVEYNGGNNKNIRFGSPIGGSGHMTFKGSGGFKFSSPDAGSYWTGGTTVELGSSSAPLLYFAGPNTKAALLDGTGGFVVDGKNRLTDGTGIAVLTVESSGTLEAADLGKVHFVNCGDDTRAYFDNDENPTKILVDYFAHPWATVTADNTTWSGLVTANGEPPANATVKMTGDYTLVIDQDVTLSSIGFSGGTGSTLSIASGKTLTVGDIAGIGYVLNNGTLDKTGDGTLDIAFDNASSGVFVVNAGTLRATGARGTDYGTPITGDPDETPRSTFLIDVKSGATYDVNGTEQATAAVRLAAGAHFVNTGSDARNGWTQSIQLILAGDADVYAQNNFGLVAPSFGTTRLDLGSHTLSVSSASGKDFQLSGTTITGSGTINVTAGRLVVRNAASAGADCTLVIEDGANLGIAANLTVKNFENKGTTVTGGSSLTVTGTLTPGNGIPKLTLASGATVKASASQKQTVTTTFSASGTITVDASEIDAQALKAAGESGIDVLTVPVSFNPSGVAWNVAGAAIAGTRAKWRTDEGGTTKTLYLGKPTGLMVIVR